MQDGLDHKSGAHYEKKLMLAAGFEPTATVKHCGSTHLYRFFSLF